MDGTNGECFKEFKSLFVNGIKAARSNSQMALGLAQVVPSAALTVVVNTGDDFEHLGCNFKCHYPEKKQP